MFQDEKITINFRLVNANLLSIPVFILLDKTYLQRLHCITIEDVSTERSCS